MSLGDSYILINGQICSPGEVITIDVALCAYAMWLKEPGVMKDLGEIGPLYMDRINDILRKLRPTPTP